MQGIVKGEFLEELTEVVGEKTTFLNRIEHHCVMVSKVRGKYILVWETDYSRYFSKPALSLLEKSSRIDNIDNKIKMLETLKK